MSPHPAPSSEGCRSLGCPTAILPLAAVVGLRWRGPGVWREGKGMKAATAQFQGGAGRIRNIHGNGPELVADEGRIGGNDLRLLDAGLLYPAKKRLEQARPEPALVQKTVEPAALAMVLDANRQALGYGRGRPIVPGEQGNFLCNQGKFVAALVVQGD